MGKSAVLELALLTMFLAAARGLPGQVQVAGHPARPVIPVISGTVIDAITGKPVAAVDVTLRAESGDRKQLRYENCRASPQGQFRFPSSVEPRAAGLFAGIGEIAFTVNIPFVSLARIRAFPGNDWVESDWGSDASLNLLSDPLFTAKSTSVHNLELKGPRVNNQGYFPMAVQFLKACKQLWDANCIGMETTRDVRVPLIPVLDDPAGCNEIADRHLIEDCRQLQTYRAAFRHVETMAQVRIGKELCDSLDHGRVSESCRDNLHGYVVNAKNYEGRPPPQMEIAPVEEALILTPIAGMPVTVHGLTFIDPFAETALYFANYRRETGLPLVDAVHVTVEFIGNADERQRRWVDLLQAPPGLAKEAGRSGMFDGSPMYMWERERTSDVAWTSGDKIVTVVFNRASAYTRGGFSGDAARLTAATPELRRELIRSYLRKYPVSN
jgi:hypothetical protein